MVFVVVVGCGGIGRSHAAAYAKLSDVKLAGFVDNDIARAEALAEQYGGEAWARPEQIPADVGGVSIVTPPATHADLAAMFLNRGIPVFCEKPLATTVPDARRLRALAHQTGMPLLTGFKMRFEPIFQMARQRVPEVGKIISVTTDKTQPYKPRPVNDWIREIGVLYELSIHDIDLVQYITGLRFISVQAAVLRHRMGWPAEDAFALIAGCTGDAIASLSGCYTPGSQFAGNDFTMTVTGEKGFLRITRPDRLVLHLDKTYIEEAPKMASGLQPFLAELANFVAVIQGQAAPFVSVAEAAVATEVVEAARAAYRSGNPVMLEQEGITETVA